MVSGNLCYMCELEATSREHVPPKALFPEGKDIGGRNLRSNLITVPSCELHNMGKSHDDEFLMVSLAGIIGNNSIGFQHYRSKVGRALRRTSYALLHKMFVSQPVLQQVDLGSNGFVQVLWGTPDQDRLLRCFDRIARGIHYHHFGKQFVGTVKSLLAFLAHDQPTTRNLYAFLSDRAELDLADQQRFGENQDVFYYQLLPPDREGLFLMKFCFYGGVSIYASFMPDGANPAYHLGFEMMKGGFKTVFTLGDKTYEIN